MDNIPDDLRATFDALFAEAVTAGEPVPTAMTLATAVDGQPSARTVLLKAFDARGFVFYTHLDGRKGRELQANPRASLLFHWPRVREGVQLRIEGDVEIVALGRVPAAAAASRVLVRRAVPPARALAARTRRGRHLVQADAVSVSGPAGG